MRIADINQLFAEIMERGSWDVSGRPGLPGYSLPENCEFQEYVLDNQPDRDLLRQRGVTVLEAGSGSIIYLDAEQKGLDVHIVGNGAGSRIVLGKCKSLTGVFNCLGDDTTLIFSGSPGEAIGLSAELINSRASMFVGAGGVCYGLRGTVEGETSIVIGDRCLISDHIELRGSDSHSLISLESGKVINLPGSILIEPYVWLCQGVTVLKNVTIGTGSVVATRSVVTKNVPSYCLTAGVPARVTKMAISWHRSFPSTISDSLWRLDREGVPTEVESIDTQMNTIPLNVSAQARAIIYSAYRAILGRDPDNDGLIHYQNYLRSRGLQTGTENLITQLLTSEERKLLEKKCQEI